MVQYILQTKTDSSRKGSGWIRVDGSPVYSSQAEAEKEKQKYEKALNEAHRVVPLGTPDQITQTVEERREDSRERALEQQNRYAEQAVEKLSQGKTISPSERMALIKTKNIIVDGYTGTGRTAMQRVQMIKAKDEQIRTQIQNNVQAEINRLTSRLQFDTAEEARKAGYQVKTISTSGGVAAPPKDGNNLLIPQGKTKGINAEQMPKPQAETRKIMTARPKADTYAESLIRKSQELEQSAPKFGGEGQRAAAFFLGAASAPVSLLNPIKTFKSTIKAVLNPKATIEFYGSELKTNPSSTIGQFTGMWATGKAGGKVIETGLRQLAKPKLKIFNPINKKSNIPDKYLEEAGGSGGDYTPTTTESSGGGGGGSIGNSKIAESPFKVIGEASGRGGIAGPKHKLSEVAGPKQRQILIFEDEIIMNKPPQATEQITLPSVGKLKAIAGGIYISRYSGLALVGTKTESKTQQKAAQVSIPKSKLTNSISTVQTPKSNLDILPKGAIILNSKIIQEVKPRIIQESKPKIIQGVKTKNILLQTPVNIIKSKQALDTQVKSLQLTRSLTAQTTKQITPRPTPLFFKNKDEKFPTMKFTAEVRRGGVFKDIGKFGSASEAFGAAERKVSTTAAASLRIKDPFGKVINSPIGLSRDQFESSKKEKGVFIEKKEKRIKSQGEKAEITYRGIAIQKASRRKGSIFSGSNKKSRGVFG